MSFTSCGSAWFNWHSFAELLAWKSLLWLSMTWQQKFLTQKYFLSTTSLAWFLTIHFLFCSVRGERERERERESERETERDREREREWDRERQRESTKDRKICRSMNYSLHELLWTLMHPGGNPVYDFL